MESFSPVPYNDKETDGNATIGYGHKLHDGPVTAKDLDDYKGGISRSDADRLFFRGDLDTAEGEIHRNVKVPLTQNQFDALVSLIYNAGGWAFYQSPLRKLLNEGDYNGVMRAIPGWKSRGISNRRHQEQALFGRR